MSTSRLFCPQKWANSFIIFHYLLIGQLIVNCNGSDGRAKQSLALDPLQPYSLSQSDHFDTVRRSLPLFSSKTLTVSVVIREPFVMYTQPDKVRVDGNKEDLDNYSGIAIEVIKRLAFVFKFRVRIIQPEDGQFGMLTADQGWTGLMGMLVRNESDVGLTALSITVSRARAVDFTREYYVETAAVLLRIPAELRNYFAIFEPFSKNVWFLLLATILLLIFLITIMTKLEERQLEQHRFHELTKFLANHREITNEQRRKSACPFQAQVGQIKEDEEEEEPVKNRQYEIKLEHKLAAVSEARQMSEFGSTWRDRFYYATTCVLNILLIRDIKNPPTQTPIRILVCVWWLSTIVIVNIYFGILFGQLVVPRRPKSIETLEELVNQDQVDWGVTKGSAIYELFRRSPADSVYGQLGLRMRNVSSAEEGVAKVRDSGWAFIRERSILTFKMAEVHNRLMGCKLQLAKEEFFSVGFGLALAKGSKYLKPFNSALTLMIENGLISRWRAKYWPTRNQFTECDLLPLREGEPLSLKHFISIYLVCALIICLALIVLIYQLAREHLIEARVKPNIERLRRRFVESKKSTGTTN